MDSPFFIAHNKRLRLVLRDKLRFNLLLKLPFNLLLKVHPQFATARGVK